MNGQPAMTTQKRRALLWTAAQYALLAMLLMGGDVFVPSTPGWLLIGAAIGLTGWALVAFRTTRLSITPLVPEGGRMISSGPYRWVRHPMYASVLLAAIGTVLLEPTWVRGVAALLLLPVLTGKLSVEETFLRQAYPGYGAYCETTKRMIPGVW